MDSAQRQLIVNPLRTSIDFEDSRVRNQLLEFPQLKLIMGDTGQADQSLATEICRLRFAIAPMSFDA